MKEYFSNTGVNNQPNLPWRVILAETFRVYAKKRGKWRTLKSFSDPSEFAEAKHYADDLLRHNDYDNAVILEKTNAVASGKPDFQVKYKATRRPSYPPPKEPIELRVQRGITGEWIAVPEKYAKRHDLYGVYGWLAFAAFMLGIGPIADLISGYDEIFSSPLPVSITVVALIFSLSWGPLYLLLKKKKSFPTVAISIRAFLIPLGILAFDPIIIGWSILMILYLMLSGRVNVTYKHRVRRSDLKRVIPKRQLKNARFVNSKGKKTSLSRKRRSGSAVAL